METTQENKTETQIDSFRQDHPWLEVKCGNLDEDIRYSLDELRLV